MWCVDLRGDAGAHLAVLSTEERARLDRLRGAARRRFAISHAAMRRALAMYLGRPPDDVPLAAPYGEPPRTPGLHLSLAHGEQLGLLAVAPAPVGVDLEELSRVQADELAELAETTLTLREKAAFERTSPPDRARAWLRWWVRKEAVLKGRGLGLSDRLPTEVDVSGDRFEGLALIDLDVGAGHVAALAGAPPLERIRVMTWPPGRRSSGDVGPGPEGRPRR